MSSEFPSRPVSQTNLQANQAQDPDHQPPRKPPRAWNPLTLALVSAMWMATACNWPLWRAFGALPETTGVHSVIVTLGFMAIVASLTFALMALLIYRVTVKPIIAVMLLSAAVGAHFMGTYNVVLDPTMMANVLQTDAKETRDLMSFWLVASVLVLALIPIALLWRIRVASLRWPRQALRNVLAVVVALVVTVGLGLATFADLSATMRNHKTLRYMIGPVNSYYSLIALAHQRNQRPSGPPTPIGLDAHPLARASTAKPPLVVLVLGETGRADHWALNGDNRPTNPELAGLGVLSWTQAISCGTSTAASVPCMFSRLGRQAYLDRKSDEENLLDVLHKAGLAVLWVDNQSGCKGVCDRVPNAMADKPAAGEQPLPAGLCIDGECLDMALLHGLDARVAALDSKRRANGVVIVLHQMGSHGPAYYLRSPADRKPFKPECTTNVLQQCSHEQLINAYDNSVVYTDHMLAETIGWLKRHDGDYDPSMFYIADHGESLGEHNLYLHGLPYSMAPIEQKHVAMITWWPSRTEASLGLRVGCMAGRAQLPVSHDNLFHTMLGLAGVGASVYSESQDLLTPCRATSHGSDNPADAITLPAKAKAG